MASARASAEPTVAVLFASYYRVGFDGKALRAAVILPLRADAIVLFTHDHKDRCGRWNHVCNIERRAADLQPIARLAIERQNTTIELASALERSPSWPVLLDGYKRSGACQQYNRTAAQATGSQYSHVRALR
jgi:hypothetical protein